MPTASGPDNPDRDRPDPPLYTSEVYQHLGHWLCHPDNESDACDLNLDHTRVEPDGTQTVTIVEPYPDAPIDCFYVYPTVSDDAAPNSDLEPGEPEWRVAKAQAAPFAPVCRVYAPVYRQITLAALGGTSGEIPDRAMAYGDVVDAWLHYLTHHNHGRGVVLIGHSQGAGHLRELLIRQIETDPDQRRLLVSAILLGTTVRVPADSRVLTDSQAPTDNGAALADFEGLVPCSDRDQLGCVISYSTYPEDAPPGDSGFFGAVRDDPAAMALCTNPAALAGGAAPLNSVFTVNPGRDGDLETPFVHYPGLASGECIRRGNYHYLEIRYRTDGTAWPSDLGGRLSPEWGLHLLDVGLALGDLIDLVGHQGAVWSTQNGIR